MNKKPHSYLQNVLGTPPLFWFIFFLFFPITIVATISFIKRGTYGGLEWIFQLDNYPRAFNWTYLKILLESFKLSLLTAVFCFILGLPAAWAMATAKKSTRSLLILGMAIPFLTNLIIRVYAIKVFLGMDGPFQTLLLALGIGFDPYALSQNKVVVLYGMVTTYLPFMVFPLYAALEKFDFDLVEAATDLGASQWRVLTTVIIPNIRPAIANGLILVFVPCLGEFVIPDLLGGAKNMLVGNLITEQFLKSRDWPFGAALSSVLMLFLIVVPFGIRRAVKGSAK